MPVTELLKPFSDEDDSAARSQISKNAALIKAKKAALLSDVDDDEKP